MRGSGEAPVHLAAELAEGLTDSRRRLQELVADLTDQQMLGPNLLIVNPPVWEIGHVAWFQEKWVLRNLDERDSLRADSDALYDSFEVFHDWRWDLTLPSRRETQQYMDGVLAACIERVSSRQPSDREAYFYRLVTLHEDMHGEAVAYTRQTLGYPEPALTGPREDTGQLATEPTLVGRDVEVPGGTFLLGAAPDAPFVFDNEKWAHPVEVAPFRIAATATTNAQFQAFVDDGGYEREELWSPAGWAWRQHAQATHPVYWEREGNGQWHWRRYDQTTPLASNHPVVHVNWYEAEAYCAWAGRRLPTEAEWEMAASAEPSSGGISGRKRLFPWGDSPPQHRHANLDAAAGGVIDVTALPDGDSAFGCRQMVGNTWEWMEDRFWPFPGFVMDPYREYSAPWFGDRRVLRGGCWATRSRLIRNTWRNFFPPDRRDVFAGFRTCAL